MNMRVLAPAPRAPRREAGGPGRSSLPGQRWRAAWPWLRRILTITFFALLATLLVRQARAIDWDAVVDTVTGLPLLVLLAAAALACASHLLYSTFDLLGRRNTHHGLPTGRVMAITFVSYAFNLNMGSLVGGVASRYRLYARMGLDAPTITRVMAFSMMTNWLGYLLLGGLLLAFGLVPLPSEWEIHPVLLPIAGVVIALVPMAYLGLCSLPSRRTWSVRGHTFQLPSFRMGVLQLAISCANWALIAGVLYVLLQDQLPYQTVLAVLLLAAVAGVITHVPAGLGVLEAVFVALLGAIVAPATLIGTLLAYRALYYLAPLAIAVLMFMWLETRHKEGAAA